MRFRSNSLPARSEFTFPLFLGADPLDFVVDVDKLGGYPEVVLDFRSQRADAENLGAVVARRNQVEPEFFHGDRES